MVNWYRGMIRSNAAVKLKNITAPVLVVWGEQDPYLGVELATRQPTWSPTRRRSSWPMDALGSSGRARARERGARWLLRACAATMNGTMTHPTNEDSR